MRRFFLYLLCFLMLISCSRKDRVPKSVIQPEQMQTVLWDIFLSEAWARQSAVADSTLVLSDEVKRRAEGALKYHNISEKKFFESYVWYLKHPKTFQVLLDSLHESIVRSETLEPLDEGIDEEDGSEGRTLRRSRPDGFRGIKKQNSGGPE